MTKPPESSPAPDSVKKAAPRDPPSEPRREELAITSRLLLGIHRQLLQFQTEVRESLDEKRLSPNELWHLTMNDPEFAWLRKVSGIIVAIDEALDDRESSIAEIDRQVTSQLRELFLVGGEAGKMSAEDKEKAFHDQVALALARDPHLALDLGKLKNQIGKGPTT